VSSWNTVLAGGMRRSVPKVWFVMYHGAFVICLRIFAWYLWITAKLEAAVHPHSASPYVHIGFSTILYTRSLLVSESGERFPMSQDSSLVLMSKCFLVFNTCSLQVRRLSKWRPTYLTVSVRGRRDYK
jgi:hypothetical protein